MTHSKTVTAASGAIPLRDQNDLQWYFGVAQTLFWRSPSGHILERAHCIAFGSDGKRISASAIHEWAAWFKHHRYDGDGNCIALRLDPEVNARATRGLRGTTGYEVEDSQLIRFASISSRLLAVERADAQSYRVLAAYYGDSGNRWGVERAGRIVSLYALTEAGRRLVADLEARDRDERRELDLRPEERIGTEIVAQERQPNDIRRIRLTRIDNQARELLGHAHNVWGLVERG